MRDIYNLDSSPTNSLPALPKGTVNMFLLMNHFSVSSLQDVDKIGGAMVPPGESWPTDWFGWW